MPAAGRVVRNTCVAAAIAFGGVQIAEAVPVLPGQNVALSGSLGDPATVVHDRLRPFTIRDNSGNIILTGTLQDRVVRTQDTGAIRFSARLRDLDDGPGVAFVTGLRIAGHAGYATDVDYASTGQGSVAPNRVVRDAGAGDGLRFVFDPNLIVPPDESRFTRIATDAIAFDQSGSVTVYAQNDFGGEFFTATITGTAAPARHPADRDGDNDVDVNDLLAFLGDYRSGEADFNGDGETNVNDLLAYLGSYRNAP